MKKIFLTGIILLPFFIISSCKEPRLIVGTQLSTPAYERPGAPGPDYVWTGGEWLVENDHYIWHEGHWDKPPKEHRTWQQGYWLQKKNGWYWRHGRWH